MTSSWPSPRTAPPVPPCPALSPPGPPAAHPPAVALGALRMAAGRLAHHLGIHPNLAVRRALEPRHPGARPQRAAVLVLLGGVRQAAVRASGRPGGRVGGWPERRTTGGLLWVSGPRRQYILPLALRSARQRYSAPPTAHLCRHAGEAQVRERGELLLVLGAVALVPHPQLPALHPHLAVVPAAAGRACITR